VADEQVIKLLEEIRDLEKQAISNQNEALTLAQAARRRQRIVLPIFCLFLFLLLLTFWIPHFR